MNMYVFIYVPNDSHSYKLYYTVFCDYDKVSYKLQEACIAAEFRI